MAYNALKGGVNLQSTLIRKLAPYRWDPLGFVERVFPWGTGELINSAGPRRWQRQLLTHIGQHLHNPATRHQPTLNAVSSGHGIGKSALVAMITLWAMCQPDCKAVITANTEVQLRTKTWPELAKWYRLALHKHWFNFGATSITARDPKHERTWRCDMVPWSETNTEAFAGLHNQGNRILLVFDEASAIHDLVWEVAEGALTDEHTEIIWLCLGNPTLSTGRFRECFGRLRHRWHSLQVDSPTVEGTNKTQLEQWIGDYGEDSDFVRVRVRGEFPRSGSSQLIPPDLVARGRRTKAQGFEKLPMIMACDLARFGDDQTVIGMRQGRKFQILGKYRALDTVQVAERIIAFRDKHSPDAIVVDGDGLGAGVVDQLQHRGYSKGLFEFHGGERPRDFNMYFNRRSEVWGLMRDWFHNGSVEIPDDPELEVDLAGPQYGFSSKNQIQLERKEDMKHRGLASPDLGDCLSMTFAVDIAFRSQRTSQLVYQFPSPNAWMGY